MILRLVGASLPFCVSQARLSRSIVLALALGCSSGSAESSAAEPLRLEVPGGRGTVEVREGQEPADEVERFAQRSRSQGGHVFEAAELQGFVDAFCSSGRVACAKPSIGGPIVLELRGIGTISVNPGQSPGEAIGKEQTCKGEKARCWLSLPS
jgi:hypothetical protein